MNPGSPHRKSTVEINPTAHSPPASGRWLRSDDSESRNERLSRRNGRGPSQDGASTQSACWREVDAIDVEIRCRHFRHRRLFRNRPPQALPLVDMPTGRGQNAVPAHTGALIPPRKEAPNSNERRSNLVTGHRCILDFPCSTVPRSANATSLPANGHPSRLDCRPYGANRFKLPANGVPLR